MMNDIQRAMFWKRISAFLFDVIILSILVVGLAFSMSKLLHYDRCMEIMDERYAFYEEKYGVTFDVVDFNQLDAGQQALLEQVAMEMSEDVQAQQAYGKMLRLTLLISSLSILLAYLILEFFIPIRLGDGQTLGKKIFSLGVMSVNGVKINKIQLFIRTVLGKYTVETMIPVLVITMLIFGTMGRTGTMLMMALLGVQLVLLAVTKNRSAIHDLMANTVVVDLPSQMIFDSVEDQIEYQKQRSAEQAEMQDY